MSDRENQGSRDKSPPCQVTYVVDDRTFRGTSAHFHESGMLINCQQPAALNKKLKLTLQFSGLKNPVEVQGEVVWTNISGSGDALSPRAMGVKFLNLERDVERLLSELAVQHEAYGSIYSCYYS